MMCAAATKPDGGEPRSLPVLTCCPECGEYALVYVRVKDYDHWKNEGVFVQQAFPYLTIDEREMLITGYCAECWDNLFGEGTTYE